MDVGEAEGGGDGDVEGGDEVCEDPLGAQDAQKVGGVQPLAVLPLRFNLAVEGADADGAPPAATTDAAAPPTDGADAPVSKNVDEVEVSERTMHLESAKLTQWCENLLAHKEPEKPGMSRLDSHTLAVK